MSGQKYNATHVSFVQVYGMDIPMFSPVRALFRPVSQQPDRLSCRFVQAQLQSGHGAWHSVVPAGSHRTMTKARQTRAVHR